MAQRKRSFTAADRQAHKRLRTLWDLKARALGLTQARAAELFEGTQPLINAYLTGRAALGRIATMKFARLLQVRPEDIRDDFKFPHGLIDEFPPDVMEMASKLSALPSEVRADLHRTIDVLLRARNYEVVLAQLETRAPSDGTSGGR